MTTNDDLFKGLKLVDFDQSLLFVYCIFVWIKHVSTANFYFALVHIKNFTGFETHFQKSISRSS